MGTGKVMFKFSKFDSGDFALNLKHDDLVFWNADASCKDDPKCGY